MSSKNKSQVSWTQIDGYSFTTNPHNHTIVIMKENYLTFFDIDGLVNKFNLTLLEKNPCN